MAARYEITEAVSKTLSIGAAANLWQAGAGLSAQIKDLQGNNLTIYTAETGATTAANPITTDSNGRIEGWVEAPDYDITISGSGVTTYTQKIRNSPPGATTSAVGAAKTLVGVAGSQVQHVYTLTDVSGGTNGSRGDAITSDAANATDHTSFASYEWRGTGSIAFDDKGSLHQTYSALKVDPYLGGGDVYCEGFNHYASIDVNRKGALAGNFEFQMTVEAGKPARAAGGRFIVNEFNAISAYDAATFGAGSSWIATGSRGVEIIAQGSGASPCGTGLQIHGSAGYNRAICFSTGGIDAFKVGSSGFVDVTRATTTGAAYRTFVSGDTNERIQIRADGALLFGDGNATPTLSITKTAASATLNVSGALVVNGTLNPKANFTHQGTNIGFFSTTPTTKQTVTGSRGGNAALASLLTALAAYGFVTDSSSA